MKFTYIAFGGFLCIIITISHVIYYNNSFGINFNIKNKQSLNNDRMTVDYILKELNEISTKLLHGVTTTGNGETTGITKTFTNIIYDFPWEQLAKTTTDKDTTKQTYYVEKLMNIFQDMNNQEPKVPINTTCKPPVLLDINDITCSNYPAAFLPQRNSRPVKIAHAIQLGFDVDSLEIHLNELYDVIDMFFIIEATKSHCRGNRKRLTWVEVSKQNRFLRFRKKIVHLIIDEADEAEIGEGIYKMWGIEGLQERLRWAKICKWNSYTNFFKDDDVIGFGDADEVASRKNIQLLKHCKMKPGSVDIGIWFPFGRMDQAFKSDFPVKKHRYTLGDPTFYRWKDIINPTQSKKIPGRQRGKSPNYLLGGCHLTYYTFLPQALLRFATTSECGMFTKESLESIFTNHLKKGLNEEGQPNSDALRHLEQFLHTRRNIPNRILPLKDIKEDLSEIVVEPWFYACNRDRYPSWEGRHDTRVY